MCAEKLAKIILIVLNIAFFIGGGAIMAVGIVAMVKVEYIYKLTSLLTDKLSDIFDDLKVLTSLDLNGLITNNAIILIAVGAFLFILGFLGCCGAMRKSSCMLNLYAILVLVILGCEVGLGVYAYMYSDKLEAQIQDGLKLSLYKYYAEGVRFENDNLKISTKAEEIAWDTVQFQTACCGVTNASDWDNADKWNKTYVYQNNVIIASLPPSCCKRTEEGAKKELDQLTTGDFVDISGCVDKAKDGSYNTEPCYDRVRSIVFDNKTIIIVVFVIVVFVEILAISCACWLKSKAEGK